MFIVRAWKNGRNASNPTLGLRISSSDRDMHFRRGERATIRLEGRHGVTVVDPPPSFWTTCPELRSPEIGGWLCAIGAFPWPRNHPLRFRVRIEAPGHFTVEGRA